MLDMFLHMFIPIMINPESCQTSWLISERVSRLVVESRHGRDTCMWVLSVSSLYIKSKLIGYVWSSLLMYNGLIVDIFTPIV